MPSLSFSENAEHSGGRQARSRWDLAALLKATEPVAVSRPTKSAAKSAEKPAIIFGWRSARKQRCCNAP
jgi:hypothetical protein